MLVGKRKRSCKKNETETARNFKKKLQEMKPKLRDMRDKKKLQKERNRNCDKFQKDAARN